MTGQAASGLLSNRNWVKLFCGQAVSLIGLYVLNITLVLWVGTVIAADQPWAPAAVAGLLACAIAPVLLVGPAAGVYVDRWDRRRTMMTTDLVRASLVASLLLLPAVAGALPPLAQLGWVYTVVAANSVAAQFFMPARFGVVASVVPDADRSRALGLMQATTYTAGIVGPPLGAPLLFTFGVHWSLTINVVALIISYAAVWAIRMPAVDSGTSREPRFVAAFREGIRFFAGSSMLIGLTACAVVAQLGAGALNTLHVFFVENNLRVDASWLGTLMAAFAVGSVLGALLAAWSAKRVGEVRFIWLGSVLTGLLLLAYSRVTSLPVALVILLLAGVPLGAVNAVFGPLVLRVTPQKLIGRVMATINPAAQAGGLLGIAVAGVLTSTVLRDLEVTAGPTQFGPNDTVFAVTGILFIMAGLWAIRMVKDRPVADLTPPDTRRLHPASPPPIDDQLTTETSDEDPPARSGPA